MEPAVLQRISITEAFLPVKVTCNVVFVFRFLERMGWRLQQGALIYNAHRWSENNTHKQDGMPYGPTPWGVCHWPWGGVYTVE